MKYRGKKQTGGQYLLDGTWQQGYYDKKTDSWIEPDNQISSYNPLGTSPWLPKPTNQINAANPTVPLVPTTQPSPFGDSPWLRKGQPNPLAPAATIVPIPMAPPTPQTSGWHNTPEDVIDGQTFDQRLPDNHPNKDKTGNSVGDYASVTDTTTKSPHNWNQDIFFGLRGAQVAATYLAGKRKNNLMNEYDYKQQSALGQMNAMPISQFQYGPNDYTTPNRMYAQQGGMMNPYSYHSKYGGNLKTIIKDYGKWSNDAGPMDMTDGTQPRYPEMKKGGFALDEMVVRDFISKLMQFGHGPHPYRGMHRQRGGYAASSTLPGDSIPQRMINPLSQDLWRKGENFQSLDTLHTIPYGNQPYPVKPKDISKIKQELDGMGWLERTLLAMQHGPDINLNKYKKGGKHHRRVKDTDKDNDMMMDMDNDMMASGGWLKGAVNPAHKGWCTPLSNPHCTGHRRAFALMMKKNHGFHNS